jgi:hypothetical protein
MSKMVNDMVIGARTLKCYTWETYFLNKIIGVRAKHIKQLKLLNFLISLSASVFKNTGYIVVIIIFLTMWGRGKTIDNSTAFSVMSMVSILFL